MKKEINIDNPESVTSLTRRWVETMVVGLNLCPFAAPVVQDESLRYSVSTAIEREALVADFLQQIEAIQQSDEAEIATTLLIVPRMLQDFYDYLDTLALFEELLQDAGLEGVLQLASFHPGYLFGGVDENDLSHWTNRSPYPTFHIIREAQMSRALTHYKNPEQIPERNMQLLRDLGRQGLIERFPPFADYC
ncbi:DUF1415 domain-containing protein [Amphritea sp. HPY]|uniref:DUF1415 domain-containing protein n=1 Tax=Amphritea sp. HPY TaxID=3421652 RepID=UPI003D7E9005